MSAVFHDIGVFFSHLADVGWTALAIALLCQFVKVGCVSRAWRNIIAAAYPDSVVRWRSVWGAILARVGVNAIVPARGGDAVGLFIVKRRVEGSTYPTLASTLVALTLFDSVVALGFVVYALSTGALPGSSVLAHLSAFDFHLPATLHNAILVQVTQSLAVLFPISPSGIGTEQALLLYTFAGKAARTTLLSFSVGMRVTLIIFNALLGFGAILTMLRTLHW